ncbi:hypothetical protein [Paraliobacillus sp. X-1268]|uniref:hypothetical protein n=1 Tax=Paraliobacillus sp. X-1268 TaxID=2213193 RepID=UPI001E47854F|nr:hypothetical protein [Paraliobacillus sp. X-1268]
MEAITIGKHIIWSIVTVCVMLLLNWGVAVLFVGKFIDYSFLMGILFVGIVRFMNSTGGMGSTSVRMSTQAQTGIKIEKEKQTFNPTVPFYTAIVYTIVALVITVIYYKDYFIS